MSRTNGNHKGRSKTSFGKPEVICIITGWSKTGYQIRQLACPKSRSEEECKRFSKLSDTCRVTVEYCTVYPWKGNNSEK